MSGDMQFIVCTGILLTVVSAIILGCICIPELIGRNDKASERSIERHLETEGGPISIYRLFDTLEIEESAGVWKITSRLYGACEINEKYGLSILKSNMKRTYSSIVDGVYFDLVGEIKKAKRKKV